MDKIFKWFTEESQLDSSLAYCAWFTKEMDINSFRGVDKLIVCFLKYCSNLHVKVSKRALSFYIKNDLERDIKKFNIKSDTMDAYDYTQISQLKEAAGILGGILTSSYDTYVLKDLTQSEFRLDMSNFFSEKKAEEMQNLFTEFYPRTMDGSNLEDVGSEMKHRISKIEELYNIKKLKNLDFIEGRVSSESEDNENLEYLFDTGLPCVDGDSMGVYTHLMTTINAQPSGGKTRLTEIHWAYKCVLAGYDCIWYTTELTKAQVENIMIAHHITQLFGGSKKIPDALLNRKKELSEEQLRIYEAARIDLFESGRYGKMIIKRGCILEELDDEVRNLLRINSNIKLLAIDYMGLIRSVPRDPRQKAYDKYQVIEKAYEIVRGILMDCSIHAVCINQYNEEGIKAAEAGRPIRSGMTEGGHCVFRYTDYDLNLTYTPEQKLAGVRMLESAKTRGTPGFPKTMLRVDLAVSYFNQD